MTVIIVFTNNIVLKNFLAIFLDGLDTFTKVKAKKKKTKEKKTSVYDTTS